MPIYYQCERCAACCRWPGQVKLSDAEVSAIAKFMNLSDHDFIQRFTRVRADRQGLALTNKPNHECVFLEEGNCAVQSVKPQQCRDFPNLWNFPGFQEVCHALPKEVSPAEYEQLVAAATKRKPGAFPIPQDP